MFPEIPNLHAGVTLLATLIALALFSRDKLPLETASLIVLAALAIFFELVPFQASDGPSSGEAFSAISLFSGFGHEALVAVIGLMVCGHGLVVTGALQPVGRMIARLWQTSPMLSLLLTLVFGGLASAFVNNTPVVVLLIPILINVAARNGSSAGPWLMPMNFSTLLGGSCTSIGTSTNLLVISVAADLGLRRLGMFDFAVPAMMAASVGLVYLWLIAPRILGRGKLADQAADRRTFSYELLFSEDSSSIGSTIGDLQNKAGDLLEIMRIKRASSGEHRSATAPLPDLVIEPGDRLTGRATAEELGEIEQILDARSFEEEDEEEDEGLERVQIVVGDNSPLIGSTLNESQFSHQFGVNVLAVHRERKTLTLANQGLGKMHIRAGDIVLVQGTGDEIDDMKSDHSLLVLDERQPVTNSSRGWTAVGILLLVIATAATGLLPIAIAAVAGTVAMLLTKCLDWKQLGNAVSPAVIMIVVVSLALGSSLSATGATNYLAEVFLYLMAGWPNIVILSALIGLMAVLTNIVSNNAAAVIGTPIGMSLASQLGLDPELFVLAVLFGANLSFATPMAYKTNVLVMGAGDYSFGDFLKVGLPLTVIMWIAFTFILAGLYGV